VLSQAYLKERSREGMLVDVLLLIDGSLPPREMDLAGVEWLASRKVPLTLVYTKCDKRKKGEPTAADNIARFREAMDQAKLLQPAQFPTAAGAGSSSSSRFGQRELLQYLGRRVAAHKAARQQPLAAVMAPS
jgi:GTP-binding protein